MSRVNLNRLLALETAQKTPDGAGGYQRSWNEIAQHWCALAPLSARQAAGETVPLAVGGYEITLRALPFDHAQRPRAGQAFRHGTRRFVVTSVTENDAAGKYLVCQAKEEQAL